MNLIKPLTIDTNGNFTEAAGTQWVKNLVATMDADKHNELFISRFKNPTTQRALRLIVAKKGDGYRL